MNERELKVTFDINTINHLGVMLYSTIPPMIAELVSNSWDADASYVSLKFENGDNKKIIVSDDGIGMSFDDLNDQFLNIGRNRRTDLNSDITPKGRKVLGKKGLGKLSMFGIGKTITISTVKDKIKNTFVMDYDGIKNSHNKEYLPTIIDDNIEVNEENGTIITIENIKRKTDFDLVGIRNSLLSRFKIFSSEFKVLINEQEDLKIIENSLPNEKCQFKWEFPKDFKEELEKNEEDKKLLDFGNNKKIVGTIYTSATPLRNEIQGIVLFSRGKLVQENKTFNSRANDNFFLYMSGSFDVDFIDEKNDVDNCSTDRKSLAWDNYENDELIDLNKLMEKVVLIAQKKWRNQRKEEKIKKVKQYGQDIKEWLDSLNGYEKPMAEKLVNAIIENDAIGEETASNYISSIRDMYGFESFKNFTQQLDDLEELSNENAIKLLTDWTEVESKELAKVSTGRIKTIEQFEKIIKSNASERDVIQKFLEEFPWLLDPKMAKFQREITFSKILKETYNDDYLPPSNRRIDFLCTNESGVIHIIELKRPSIKLTSKEITQIAEYVEFIKRKYPQNVDYVCGYLISDNMTFDPGVDTIRKGLESQNVFVKSYSDLLAEAKRYNNDVIELYSKIQEKKSEQ